MKLLRFMPVWFYAVGGLLVQIGIAYCNDAVFVNEKVKKAFAIGIMVIILTQLGIAVLTQFTTKLFAAKAIIAEAIFLGLGGITFGLHLWHMSEKDAVAQVQNQNEATIKNNQQFTTQTLGQLTDYQKAQTKTTESNLRLIKEAQKKGLKVPNVTLPSGGQLDATTVLKSGQGQIVDTSDFNAVTTSKWFLGKIRFFNILDIIGSLLAASWLMFHLKGNMDVNQNDIPDNEEEETENP